MYAVFCYITLGLIGQMAFELVGIPLAVEQECAAGFDILNYLVSLDIRGVVAGNKVCLADIVRRFDGLIAEAEMRDGHAAGLL